MAHDQEWLCKLLTASGWKVSPAPDDDGVLTTHHFAGREVLIRTTIPEAFPRVHPNFALLERSSYGAMAHVSWRAHNEGTICIGSPGAYHLNYGDPDAVATDGLTKAVDMIESLLTDDEWNREELLREFSANWLYLVSSGPTVIVMADPGTSAIPLRAKLPDKESKHPADGRLLLVSGDSSVGKYHSLRKRETGRREEGKGLLLPLQTLLPPPPQGASLFEWWSGLLAAQPQDVQKLCHDAARHTRGKDLYIAVRVVTDHGPTWFAFRAQCEEKSRAPVTPDTLEGWKLEALHVDSVITPESLLPRSGARIGLQKRKVCIVGCGSVGGYVADMLASSGVGELTLVDYDTFRPENIHRHCLGSHYLYYKKTVALSVQLEQKYPFVRATSAPGYLESFLNDGKLDAYDAVVLATGDVTLERYANEILHAKSNAPILISAWVDAYGVGGHAIASMPGMPGCLSCIYHSSKTGELALYPDLSFIASGQNVLTSHAGCGSEYIAYSSLDARQTATIAARLTLKALSGGLSEGVSMSWKGADRLAREHGIRVSERFHEEERIIQEIPLAKAGCHVCS